MRKEKTDKLETVLGYAMLIIGVAIIATMIASFPLGAATFFSPSMGGSPLWKSYTKLSVSILGLFLELKLPSWVNYAIIFSFLWSLHAILFAISLLYPKTIIHAIKRIKELGPRAILDNAALTVATIYPPLFLTISVLERALEYSGVPVGQLPLYDPRTEFLGLLQASVIEEIGFRATLIGVVALMIAVRLGGGFYSVKALWNPATTLEKLGLPVSRAKLNGIVIFSALVFGWAHIIYSSGVWHYGKLVSATIAGIGLGYMFLFMGLPAAILVHWGFNYYYATYYFLDNLRGLPTPSELNLASLTRLFEYSQEYIVVLITLQSIFAISYAVTRILSQQARKNSYT